MQVCRLPLPEGWKSGSHSCRRRSAAPPGNFQPSATCLVYVAFHRSASVQIANNSGYIQVDWKRVEKDVNKAKKQLKKETDRAAPELNTIFEKVTFLFFFKPTSSLGEQNSPVVVQCIDWVGGFGSFRTKIQKIRAIYIHFPVIWGIFSADLKAIENRDLILKFYSVAAVFLK